MYWSPQQRARAVEVYFHEGSWSVALRRLRREWGPRKAPGRGVLRRWVQQFRERGSVQAARNGRHVLRTALADLARLRRAIRCNPRLSIRRLSTKTGLPRATIHRLLRHELGFFPYKLQLKQRLYRRDKAKRGRFCRWLLGKWGSPVFRRHLLVSDEANFYLNGCVNKQNCRVWGEENPHTAVDLDQQSPHLTVWCGLSSRGMVGHYFLQSREGL